MVQKGKHLIIFPFNLLVGLHSEILQVISLFLAGSHFLLLDDAGRVWEGDMAFLHVR